MQAVTLLCSLWGRPDVLVQTVLLYGTEMKCQEVARLERDCQFCCSAISEFYPTFTRPQGREAPTDPPNYQMSHKLDYLYRPVIYLAWECNGYIAAHLTLQCPLTDIPYIEAHTNSSHHSGTTASVPMPKWH